MRASSHKIFNLSKDLDFLTTAVVKNRISKHRES